MEELGEVGGDLTGSSRSASSSLLNGTDTDSFSAAAAAISLGRSLARSRLFAAKQEEEEEEELLFLLFFYSRTNCAGHEQQLQLLLQFFSLLLGIIAYWLLEGCCFDEFKSPQVTEILSYI